jgi:hypothetical protein
MRLDFQVVVVRDTFDGRLRVVAAIAVLIVELASQRLLVAESDLFELEVNLLMRLVEGASEIW